jgi:hypothetical protein
MQPSTSRSFAAALRKLAKQAMPTGTSSPATSSCSGSQPASPTISHASSRSAGKYLWIPYLGKERYSINV